MKIKKKQNINIDTHYTDRTKWIPKLINLQVQLVKESLSEL